MRNIAPDSLSDDDLELAKLKRNSALNPPKSEPGMSDDDDDDWGSFGGDDDDDSFGSLGGDDPFGGGSFGSPLGGSPLGGPSLGGPSLGGGDPFGRGSLDGGFGNFGMGNPQPQQKEQKNPEDKFFDAILTGGKGSFNFAKELVESFKDFDKYKRMMFGRNIVITSGLLMFIAIISMLMGVGSMVYYLISGMLSLGVGVIVFMFALSAVKSTPKEEKVEIPEPDVLNDITEDEEFSDDFTEDAFIEDVEEEDLFVSAFEDEDDWEEEREDKPTDSLEVLKEMNSNMGMLTRQYLYEVTTAVLEHKNSKFNNIKNLPEESREFLTFASILDSAAENLRKGSDETTPQLLKVKDKLFYTLLEISRVKWLKNIDHLIEEIVNIVRYDEETGKIDENIYGTGHIVGDKMYIKIFKGETAMVTLKDAYKKVGTDILSGDAMIPVILGIDEEGEVIWEDFKGINSMLVTGMPRSGKSWFVKALLAQMMMFLTPSELNFYFLDPKADISDFNSLYVPHIRKFVSSNEDILEELRWVVKTEGKRRKKVLKDAGNFIDFWDLKKKRPDIELPLLYVVIDEVVTLAEDMDNETKKEFQGLLTQLVSQLPALGIRILMIPHVIKDQVLKKTITTLIPCRISVMGDAEHIENTTGAKSNQFTTKLINQGDMAVRLGNKKTKFVHGIVISSTNAGTDSFFDFLRDMWLKINPAYIKGSKYERFKRGDKTIKNSTNYSEEDIEEDLNSYNEVGTGDEFEDIEDFSDLEDEEIELF